MKKAILAIVIIALILCGMWVVGNWRHLSSFPTILSSYYSKEYCSCYYVTGGEEEFCHEFVSSWLDIDEFRHDKDARRITVSGLGRTNSAVYRGEALGCVLEN